MDSTLASLLSLLPTGGLGRDIPRCARGLHQKLRLSRSRGPGSLFLAGVGRVGRGVLIVVCEYNLIEGPRRQRDTRRLPRDVRKERYISAEGE